MADMYSFLLNPDKGKNSQDNKEEKASELPKKEVLPPQPSEEQTKKRLPQKKTGTTRVSQTLYLDKVVLLEMNQALKKHNYKHFPKETSKSAFIESLFRYALEHVDDITFSDTLE